MKTLKYFKTILNTIFAKDIVLEKPKNNNYGKYFLDVFDKTLSMNNN